MKEIHNPKELAKPVGFAHAVSTSGGKTVYLAGQVSMDAGNEILFVGNIVKQFEQTLANLQTAVRSAGGEMTDIVKLTIFVIDRNLYKEFLKEIGAVYRTYFGKYFPAMTLVEVSSLFEDLALLEIEGVAVIDQ
jgi:enamine deaminase RidA (YjgF/YER057c/UK114 family)